MGDSHELARRSELPGPDALQELALNLRWSWNHASDEIWGQLDPELWELTQNPWVVLQTTAREKLERKWADPEFESRVHQLVAEKRAAEEGDRWFQKTYPASPLTGVAYFSMEYMLSEALPIYSGGLGNVAGDQLKTASDLGVPVTAIGLLYQQGYFRQEIDSSGSQQAFYPFNDPGELPIRPLRAPAGEWLRIELRFPGATLWVRTWEVQVGRARLFLLDTNDPANLPAHRGITSELYGGGPELRLQQELILGIAGWRLLRALNLSPEVCHLNEGHAGFAVLERARSFMVDKSQPFPIALNTTRAGNLFTTHTPVEAGFDRFAPALLEKYLKRYAEQELSIPLAQLIALGRRDPNDPTEPFNMAYLSIRGSGAVNGVSRLHGQVSRQLFQVLFPRWPKEEVPVSHITNGVHVPTWDSVEADALWTQVCGPGRWLGPTEDLEPRLRSVDEGDLWAMRARGRGALIESTRRRLVRQLQSQGAADHLVEWAHTALDVDTLTLGFARRFATYKRPTLLLHDPDRLARILTNPVRPVQLILAGKAHPQDSGGQAMIRQWIEFLRRPEVREHVVFLADYNMLLTQDLVQGVDVWINTPRRPWEASGTSGMKVLVNGGLNLSELDGWWAEAYADDGVGWALGDGREHGDDPAWDAAEADALYRTLEEQIVPEFYDRDARGIPSRWVSRIRESMARLTPRFSANRAVREYTEAHYLPLAAAYRRRAEQDPGFAASLIEWRRTLDRHWHCIRFDAVTVTTQDGSHHFDVRLYLDELDPAWVSVELFAMPLDNGAPERYPMARSHQLIGSTGGWVYTVRIPASRPAADYTARVIPYRNGASIPLEAAHITWQR